jgi:hypothetical protein
LCPVCCEPLATKNFSKDLVDVLMIDKEQKEYHVCFSSIAGEHTTFKIEENNIVEEYGEDSSAYLDYFVQKMKHHLTKPD